MNSYSIHVLLLVISLIGVIHVDSIAVRTTVDPSAPSKFDGNNHYYQVLLDVGGIPVIAQTLSQADSSARALTTIQESKILQGYLLTIESREEYDFVKQLTNAALSSSWWLGARHNIDDFTWSWTGGHTKGQLVYSTLEDRCYRYCAGFIGTFDTSQTALMMSPTGGMLPSDDEGAGIVIIEYGGEEDIKISQIDQFENTLTITDCPSMPTSITMLPDYFCTNIKSVATNSYTCQFSGTESSMSGAYNIAIVLSPTQTITITGYSFASPFVSALISPNNSQGAQQSITIAGSNLGDIVTGALKFRTGLKQYISCSYMYPGATAYPTFVLCGGATGGLTLPYSTVHLVKSNGNIDCTQTRVPFRLDRDDKYFTYFPFPVTHSELMSITEKLVMMNSEYSLPAFVNSAELSQQLRWYFSPMNNTAPNFPISFKVWSGATSFVSNPLGPPTQVNYNGQKVNLYQYMKLPTTLTSGNLVFETINNDLKLSQTTDNSIRYTWYAVYGIRQPEFDLTRQEYATLPSYNAYNITMKANYGVRCMSTVNIVSPITLNSTTNCNTGRSILNNNDKVIQIKVDSDLTASTLDLTVDGRPLSVLPFLRKPIITQVTYSYNTVKIEGEVFGEAGYLNIVGLDCIMSALLLANSDPSDSIDCVSDVYQWNSTIPVITSVSASVISLDGGVVSLTGKRLVSPLNLQDTTNVTIPPHDSEDPMDFQLYALTFGIDNQTPSNPNSLSIKYVDTTTTQNGLTYTLSGTNINVYHDTIKIKFSDGTIIDSTKFNHTDTSLTFTLTPTMPIGADIQILYRLDSRPRTSLYFGPNHGLSPRSQSIITGAFFKDSLQVTVGGVQAIILSKNGTHIMFTAPELTGEQDVVVHNDDGTVSAATKAFYKAPSVTSAQLVGSTISIVGDLFGVSSSSLSINGITLTALKPTQPTYTLLQILLTKSELDTLRSGNITVTLAGQSSNTFSFYTMPTITNTPMSPVDGGLITLTGDFLNALSYAGDPILRIDVFNTTLGDSKPCTNILDVQGGVQCIAPPGSGKNRPLQASNKEQSRITSIRYMAPHIDGVSSTYEGQTGVVSITGSNFADAGLDITIGGLGCQDAKLISSRLITCSFASTVPIPPGQLSLNVTVQVDGQSHSSFAFIYLAADKKCPNGCTSPAQGTCMNGVCLCNADWNGALDCSVAIIKIEDKPEIHVIPPVIKETAPLTTIGSTTQTGDKSVNFQIGVTHIREVDINGAVIVSLSMDDIKWYNISSPNTTDSIASYVGSFPSYPGITVSVNVTVFLNETSYNFAGDTLQVLANSVKYQIEVSNFTFQANTNSLQVIFLTQTPYVKPSDCDREVSVTSDTAKSLQFFEVNQGSTVMRGRFSDRLIADSRIAKSQVRQLPPSDPLSQQYSATNSSTVSVLTAITTPNFLSNVIIDPSFGSLLIVAEPLDTCDQSSGNSQKWKLPTIIVASIIGAACIIILSAILVKKKLGYRSKLISLKLRNLTKRNKV
eukprot:gene4120-4811_t